MKEYKDKIPAIVVGGVAGSFLGEYQAGGVIVVLGLHRENQPIAGYFCGTGMHGGKIYLRSDTLPEGIIPQRRRRTPAVRSWRRLSLCLRSFAASSVRI